MITVQRKIETVDGEIESDNVQITKYMASGISGSEVKSYLSHISIPYSEAIQLFYELKNKIFLGKVPKEQDDKATI